jgi:nucleoside-diphosphate-sugar epimerase
MARNKKGVILVTGVSGRIGRAVVHRFGEDYRIIGFDTHQVSHTKDMEHLFMDVSNQASVHNGFQEARKLAGDNIVCMIHLAAYYSFSGKASDLYEKVTVQGTKFILDELQSFNCQQFMFASTILVHKPCTLGQKINEDWPLGPRWAYPKSKVRTENIIHNHRGDIQTTILRIAGCYDDMCHSVPISHDIQRIYETELDSHLFPGNPLHGNPFLHMEDLMDAFENAVNKRKQLPEETTLIVSEDKTIGYADLQNQISELIRNKPFKTYRIPKLVAKVGAWCQDRIPFYKDTFIQPWMIDVADDHYDVDISLARKVLGWSPKHFIGKTLPLIIENLKKDPINWYKENDLEIPEKIREKVRGRV